KGDLLTFTIGVDGKEFHFEGKLNKADGKKIMGSIRAGNRNIPAMLEATTARTVFEADKEFLARNPTDPRIFDIVLDMIGQAVKEKATANEVREWSHVALKAGANHGQRWQIDFAFRLMDALTKEKDLAGVAVEVARSAQKFKEDA